MASSVPRFVGVDPLAFSMALKLTNRQMRQVIAAVADLSVALSCGEAPPEPPSFDDPFQRTVYTAFSAKMRKISANFRKSISENQAAEGESISTYPLTYSLTNTSTNSPTHRPDAFARVWGIYPKKSGLRDAAAAWDELKADEETTDAIISGIDRWVHSEAWTKENGRFVKQLGNFLRARAWQEFPAPQGGYTQRLGGYSTEPVCSDPEGLARVAAEEKARKEASA